MHGFRQQDLLVKADYFEIWRRPHLVAVQIWGTMDNDHSAGWRAAVAEEFRVRGVPKFFAIDISRSEPTSTMAGRLRTATFARMMLAKIEWATVLTRETAGPTVVVRAILRAGGMANVSVRGSEGSFHDDIDAMSLGQRPRSDRSEAV